MTVRAVLLDKDGTLVDFDATWLPATVRAARRLCGALRAPASEAERLLALAGYDPAREACVPGALISGGTTRELAELWSAELARAGHGSWEASRTDAFLEAAFERDVRGSPVGFDGVAQTLARLRDRGLRLGVATMDIEHGAHAMLRGLGIDELFEFVCGSDSGHGEKPDAGMVHAFCTAVDVRPEDTAVVGDTTHDCAMGASAGVALIVGVLSGATERAALEPHCHHVLASAADLEQVL